MYLKKKENQTKRCIATLLNDSQTIPHRRKKEKKENQTKRCIATLLNDSRTIPHRRKKEKKENQTKRCIATLLNDSQTILCVCLKKKGKSDETLYLHPPKRLSKRYYVCVLKKKKENQTKRCITTLLNDSQTISYVFKKKRKIRRNVISPRS